MTTKICRLLAAYMRPSWHAMPREGLPASQVGGCCSQQEIAEAAAAVSCCQVNGKLQGVFFKLDLLDCVDSFSAALPTRCCHLLQFSCTINTPCDGAMQWQHPCFMTLTSEIANPADAIDTLHISLPYPPEKNSEEKRNECQHHLHVFERHSLDMYLSSH